MKVDGKDGPGSIGDLSLAIFRIEGLLRQLDVSEHGFGAAVDDRIGSCAKGHGWQDDLIPRAYPG